jgi:4-hydroxybenzoate polyprenyltransferase
VSGWRQILRIGRPGAWIITALPFLAAAFVIERGLTPLMVIGTVYFLGPFNLLLHGFDAIHGGPSPDEGTAAAQDRGFAVSPDGARLIRIVIAATNLPLLIILVVLGGASLGVALAVAVVVAIAWSVPPVRTRDRPVLDVVSGALLVVVPAVAGFLVAGIGIGALPWLPIAAFAAWAVAACCLLAIHALPVARALGVASTATRIGPRATAVIAFVGFALAAALAASQGRVGALAALGLDLYLLLPAMVLLARRGDPVAEDAAGRRAWTGFIGLNDLVGIWLVVLWVRFTALTGIDAWQLATVVAGAAAGYALANVLAIRLTTRRRRTRPDPDAEVPALTVIVPCRDEAARLPDCLAALLEQTYADTSLLVIDDGSSDGSDEVAAEWLAEDGRVIVAPTKPDGWTGRAWACQVGADASTSDLLLFVDADTVLVPVAIRILVEQLQARRLDLLSGLTRYGMPTRSERIAVPGHPLLLFGFVPIWLASITRGRLPRAAFAYGPLMLVRRDAYLAVGGHGANPASLHDDADLARTMTARRRRVGTAYAADLGVTRHFPDAEAAIRAWRRILLPYANGSLAVAIATVLLETTAWVLPLVLPLLAVLSDAGPRLLLASFAPLLLLGAMRVAMTLTQRQPFTSILWHPITVGLTLLGQLAAIVDHVTGRAPRWRGRIVESPRIMEPAASEPPPPAGSEPPGAPSPVPAAEPTADTTT